jgi:hypothetical protein
VFANPKIVGRRRLKRRLKAAASIVVAIAAGTFLACQRQVAALAGDAAAEDASAATPGAVDAAGDVGDVGIEVHAEDGSPLPVDAALVVADARSDALARPAGRSLKDAAVDVNQHRKGMPVPDNLLE